MPRKVAAPAAPSGERVCCFCGLKEDNELEYGKIHEYNGIVTHYYCLLLSSNMQQKGRDDEGILGFLPEDINKELRRGKRLSCCYCKRNGATLGCCNTKCKQIFHFPCGLKSGSLHQFFGEFRSYCRNHRPRQKIDVLVSEEVKKRDDLICYICYDEVNPSDRYRTLWAPCCKKNAWFHRSCVQQLAMSAGYFFKCPLCNNKTDFQKAMLDHGIFIPSQDASWELVPNAFEELLYRHNRCDAEECLCPKGREHTSANAKWELTLCRTCGSQGIHMACGQLKWVRPVWECGECTSILNKTLASDSESNSVERTPRGRQRLREEDNEDSSDSEISVGTETTDQSSSPSKSQEDESRNVRENDLLGERVRITRRSVIPIPRSPVNTRVESPKATTATEDVPPEPKRPRLSDSVEKRSLRESTDSDDDDVMVISGPSNDENNKGDTRKTSCEDSSSAPSIISDENVAIDDLKEESEDPKMSDKISSILYNSSNTELPTLTPAPVRSEPEKKVIEIDLSEPEGAPPETSPPKSTEIANPAGNSVGNPPELNIMISNVTSLAPEAFDGVQQEEKLEGSVDSPKITPSAGNFSASAGGLTAQTPIVLDDEPLPPTPNNSMQPVNNLGFLTNGLHDQITIVRFNGISNTTGENTVFYGLNIPGTNQTIPLIFTPVENPNPSAAPAISDKNSSNEPLNNNLLPPLAPLSIGNPTGKPENIQNPPTTPNNRNETPSRPNPTLSMSVPLKSIVNERFPTPPVPSRKSVDNNSPNVTIANPDPYAKMPPLVPAPKSSRTSSALQAPVAPQNTPKTHDVSTKGSDTQANNNSLPNGFATSPAAKQPILSAQTNNKLANGFGPPAAPKTHSSNADAIKSLANNIDVNMIAKMLTTLPKEAPRAPQVYSLNGISEKERRFSTYGRHSHHRRNHKSNPVHTNSTETRPTTHISQSTQLHIQKSAENKQSIAESHVYQVFGTESHGSADNCDGDAGSGPAVQPASVINPTNAKPSHTRHDPEISCQGVRKRQVGELNPDERTSGRRSDTDTDDEDDRSASSDWSYSSNRAGLIYQRINLRNINFSVRESNTVKMTLFNAYTVNIEADSFISRKSGKYSSWKKSGKSSLRTEAKVSDIESSDAENIGNPLESVASEKLSSAGESNEFESTCSQEEDVSCAESVDKTNDLSPTDVESRVEDEVKENLDPIPPSPNSASNAVYMGERKSKLRPRSGGNHSMRSLNEKESQQTISEKSETLKKAASQESQSAENRPKLLYNGWKDSECYDESIDHKPPDRSVEITNNLTRSIDENDVNSFVVDSGDVNPGKQILDGNLGEKSRKLATIETLEDRNKANFNHLVNGAVNSKRKWSSSDDASRPKKFHVNSTIDGRRKNRRGESVSCRVSIDLKKIKAFLDEKLTTDKNIETESHQQLTTSAANRIDRENLCHSKSLMSKSRSFDNLSLDSRQNFKVTLRKTKSFENLNKFHSYVNNTNRNCKETMHHSEKHDCIR